MRGRRALLAAALGAALAFAGAGAPAPAGAQEVHLVVVVGIGGDPAYTARFLEWGVALHTAATERYGVAAERAILLAEDPTLSPAITAGSRREDVTAQLAALAGRAGAGDRVLIVLLGHGSFRDGEATFNLPGPDLGADEWRTLIDALPARQVAVVNAASSSGPFIQALAAPGRIVITATASGNERNETRFGEFFAAAWSDDSADLDRDGTVSLLEAFLHAQRETERFYADQNRLLTEHAVLDDTGDGVGSREPGVTADHGSMAAIFTLQGGPRGAVAVEGALTPIPATSDTVLVRLYRERAELEGRVAELRRMRGSLDPELYERELEELLIDLALRNREIRAREGGP